MKLLYSLYPENKLITLLVQGDKEAWGELYSRYQVRLYTYAAKVVKDESSAKDITHDTFLKLWDMRESIKSKNSIGPLIFIISKNLILNGIRKTVNSKLYEDYVIYRNGICDDCTEAEKRVDYDIFKKRILSTLQSMPKLQREVFILSRFDGLKNKEIAERLDIQEQTVKNKISMTLKEIREKMSLK